MRRARELIRVPMPQSYAEEVVDLLFDYIIRDRESAELVERELFVAALETIASDPYTDAKALARIVAKTKLLFGDR